MSIFDKLFLIFIVVFCMSFSYAVIKTASNIEERMNEIQQEKEMKDRRIECRAYYNDGTDRWKDCMGVGYR